KGVPAEIDPRTIAPGARLPFAFELDLRGSEALELLPVGLETRVELRSSWLSPSFRGAFLPGHRELDAAGFRATWTISPFARAFPQRWAGPVPDEGAGSGLGAPLFGPRD